MADPFGIAGLTGTAEQVVRLVIALIDRHDAYKNNNDLALEMLEAYKALSRNVRLLRDDPHLDIIQDPHREILKGKIDRVSDFVKTTLTELQGERKDPKGKLRKFSKAVSERDILVERKQDAAEQRKEVESASAYLSLYAKIDSVAINKDVFKSCVWAPRNPDSVYIDLKLRQGHGAQDTCERQLKAAVLRTDGSAQVGAFAVGQGGVGKTCALRAIAHDEEVRARFPGGVYFLTLGQDASVGRLMQQFCLAVNATRGHSTAEKMREQTELQEVLSLLVSWFGDRICLFIFDDVWARNGINKEILQQLSVLAGSGTGIGGATSRIMYSTRDRDLTLIGQSIAFGARFSRGSDAEMMLRQASGPLCDEENSSCSEEAIHAIHAILDMCAGLPLALNVAGTSVKYMKSQRRTADVSSIWQLYLDKVKNRGGMSGDSPGDGYSSLKAMLLSSIDILESNSKAAGEQTFSSGLSHREMHRGLCVMEKQDWIPVSVLKDLWETDDENAAEKLAMQMSNVGLVDFEYGRGCAGLRMHDLTLDFTVDEADANEGCAAWFGKVVDKYSRERGLVAAAVEDGSLDDNRFREEYVEENIYRLLMGAGRLEDLKNLLLSPEWVVKVLRRKAVLQYERAVKDLQNCWRRGEGRREVDKDAISGMQLVMKAARLSLPFCDENTAGICFQLYARMMYKASSLESVRRFLSDMKAWAPEPWLCPVNECLHRAGGNMVEVFMMPDPYRDRWRGWIVSNVSERMDVGEIFIVCACNTDGSDVAILRFSREEPVEVVNVECEGPQLVQDRETSETVGSDTLEQSESMRESQRPSTGPEQAEQGSIFNRTRRWVAQTVGCFGKILETCLGSSNISATASNDTAGSQATSASASDNGSASDASDRWGVVDARVCGSGERIAVLYANDTAMVWGVSEKRAISRFQVGRRWQYVSCMLLSSDGQLLVLGYSDGTVQVWSADEGTQVGAAMCGDTSPVRSIGMSSDWKYLVSGSENGTIRVWDVRAGSQLGQTMTGHTYSVDSVAIRGDGGQVLSGSFDETVRLWDVKTGSQVGRTMIGHENHVNSVAMSKDGKRAVSGSEDMTIRYWDLETQSQIGHPMAGHTGEVLNVAMSADGARALSGSTDGTLRMWDVKMEWEEEAVKTGHTAGVSCISLSENGKRVVSGSDDITVRMWDAQSGVEIGNPVPVSLSYVTSVAMSANGRRAVSGDDGRWIRCWDVGTGVQIGEAKVGDGRYLNSVAIDGEGRLAVSGSEDGSVCVWDVEKGLQLRSVLTGHTGEVLSVAISSDGARAISGSDDGEVLLWDTKSGSKVWDSKSGHSDCVRSVAMSANGRRAISGARDGTIMFWDVGTGLQVSKTLEGDGTLIESVAVCAKGRVAVSGCCDDGRVVVWNAENGSQVGETMLDHNGRVQSVAMSADGSRVESVSWDTSAIVWNTKTRTQVGQALIDHTSDVKSVAMSGNGSLVVSGSENGTVRVWDAKTGLQVGEAMAGHTSGVHCVATSSDGKHAISGSYDGSTRIWDLEKSSEITKTGHTGSVRIVMVSADGSRAVSVSGVNSILAWDVETGLQIVGKAMTSYTSWVQSVAISADGRRTVSGCSDGSVRAWDTESGAQICSALHGHDGDVRGVAISADGEWAVSGGDDETVRVWDLQAGAQSGKTLTGHTATVFKVAISADTRRVVSWSWDDTVRVWDVTRGTCDKIMTEIKWQSACFHSIIAETDAKVSTVPTREMLDVYLDDNNKIMCRREDGVEVVLARFDVGTNREAFQVDHRNGIVVAGLKNGSVAVLKLLS
ncbi:WD40-repeat containing protein [Chondrus crispus]|uniref:WD40-repeat containing protein n=1 Tax=Chondrus crispus TaxID=2769 RepID=R7QLN1_CHOCR|nr:WD40-repeat containing protein [Chondrus crispus]CDF38974.1 WD40-repeat containing protein [Chondrus crispus]|eukprot:XP_005718879.1 WD40-repeat containing protein [Chondrus crispus]